MKETKIILDNKTIVIKTEKTEITYKPEVISVVAPNINLESDK